MGSREQTLTRSGAAGGRQLLPMGATVQLITVPAADRYEGEPGVWTVAIGYDTALNLAAGELNVSAEVVWGSGRGRNVAEIDVPVRGTQFTVSGAELLEVRVTRGGACTDPTVFVSATAALGRGTPSIPAQRTHGPFATPWVAGFVRIPRFARECRVVSDVPLNMIGVDLNYISENALGTIINAVPVPNPTSMPIPLGAEFYTIGGPGTAVQNVRVIWELRL